MSTAGATNPPDDGHLRALVGQLDRAEKVALLTGASFWALPSAPTIGLRRVVMSDGPVGVRGERYDEREPSSCLPTPSAVGASWDVELAERLGQLLGDEARERNVDVVLAPTLNLQRDPRGGRNFENFAEDPLLVSAIGAAVIRGIQSRGVAATAKHFVANDCETDRFTTDVEVDETTLREVYLQPFEAAVAAGVQLVMAAYNSVGGTTMTEHPLLRDVLKGEWGFTGAVVSDWFAARSLAAAGAGLLDLVMPGPSAVWGSALVADESIDDAAIDDKVLRLLRVAAFVGVLDSVDPPASPPEGHRLDEHEVAALLRHAATAGTVLLRNETVSPDGATILPLSATIESIALIGEPATRPRVLGGGSATVIPPAVTTFADGVRAAAPAGCRVTVSAGVPIDAVAVAVALDDLAAVGDGGPGMLLTYHGSDGVPLASEHRAATVIQWSPEGSAGVAWGDIRTIGGTAVLRPRRGGRYRLAVVAPGHTRLTVGDATVDGVAARTDDDNGVVHRPPPEVGLEIELAAGREVPVAFVHEPDAGWRAGGAALMLTMVLVEDEASLTAAIATAAEVAATHDVAVIVVGTGASVESEGFDRASLALPGWQDELVAAVAAANRRTVVVVNAGAPVLMPWRDEVAAILVPWFPGQQAGAALADVLFGRAEPGGRLALTWPGSDDTATSVAPVDGVLRYAEGLAFGDRHSGTVAAAAYRFGHGLGYTSWAHVSTIGELSDDALTLAVEARNSGPRPGREVVAAWAVIGEVRRLVGFATVTAEPGSTASARIAVTPRRLARWRPGHGWVLPDTPLTVTIAVGPASAPAAEVVVDPSRWSAVPLSPAGRS